MIPFSFPFKIYLGLASLTVLAPAFSSPQAYGMEINNSNVKQTFLKISSTPLDCKAQPLTTEYFKGRISKANAGDIEVQDEVVNLYHKGSYREFLKPEMFASWKNIQDRCDKDDKYAFFVICKKNFEAIAKQFPDLRLSIEKRAEQGHPGAQNNLGIMCQNGTGGLEKDEKKAVHYFTRAADNGYADAQVNLGIMLINGQGGLKKDENEAVRLFTLALNQGNPIGQLKLGFMYLNGRGGLPIDKGEAFRLHMLAANQGNAAAQDNLDFMYKEYKASLSCMYYNMQGIKLVADKGYAPAQYDLGIRYKNDDRWGERNYGEALRWLMKSKLPDAKIEIRSLLGIPHSFGKEEYSFDGKKYVGSFKDMLDYILGEVGPDERENHPQLVMGLISLVSTHQNKKNTKNSNLNSLYETVEAVEAELLDLISSLKESSSPGFMIPAFKNGNDVVLKELQNPSRYKDKPCFFSEYSLQVTTDSWFKPVITDHYYSFGEQNVSLSEKLVQCLTTIDKRWEEADTALKEIALLYQSMVKPDQKEFDDLPDVLSCGQSKQSRMMQQAKNDAEKERRSLENIRGKIKALPYFGRATRAWEFFEEYKWLK